MTIWITDRRQIPELVYAHGVIPNTLSLETIDSSILPAGWRQFAAYSELTQRIGRQWLAQGETAILKVPSAISEAEWNFLLNPQHPDFQQLRLAEPKPFAMDPRMP